MVEVWQCRLRCGAQGGQCKLRSGARLRCGSAEIWRALLISGRARWNLARGCG